ncbi:MAG: hypothetical protein LBV59_04665 [Sphingobacterium sp.]|jgi:hypothetical protein|uniref:hypothetical protein n=1 Tax=Sphingobacterium sp. TaxID=341027 RepID=UPI00285024E7|nr:hypothetical protein [Sphingobacterium sp.]MDR3007202.1 hypothetical protein [Sphingobacterium sp.]
MIDIFISHPTPFNDDQKMFLNLLKRRLSNYGMNAVNLGINNWDYRKPLIPIKELIIKCKGAILVGLVRHHSYIGYEKENSSEQIESVHKYTTSPWIHLEGGMAYQAGLPIIILKEDKVFAEGILDPNNSESYILSFKLNENIVKLSDEIEQIIKSWVERIN